MAVTATGSGNVNSTPRVLVQSLLLIAVAGLAAVLITRVTDAGRRILSTQTAPSDASLQSHCAQFIMLAQTHYAEEWKYRLDPADTVCTEQVQKAWEIQSAQHKAKAEEPTPPSSATSTPVVVSEPPPEENVARARNPETYCLNLISLARSRHGPEWKHTLSLADSAGCEGAIAAAN